MRLHDLKPAPGSKHRKKRLGKGESSGLGKTSGKGHKGQKSRSGASIRPGFEGGQMPLYRRLPRRGFNNAQFKTKYAIVNLADLEVKFKAGDTVNEESLRACGLVKGTFDGIKLLGNGDLTKKLEVSVDKISATAKEKLEKAGGSVTEPAAPAKKKEASAKKEESPAKKKEASAKKEESPAKKKEASAKKEEAPAKKEEAPAKKEEAPAKKEKASDKKEENTGKE